MKNQRFLILLIFFVSILSISCSKEETKETPGSGGDRTTLGFDKTFGGLQDDLANTLHIKNNELYIFGTTKSLGDINGDHYLVKTDLNGNIISEHTFGGSLEEEGINLLETDDGNFILLGSTTSSGAGQKDIHAIKIDDTGNVIWEKTYGGLLDDTPQEIIELSNSEFCIAATTESFGAGSRDIYMVWIDQNGNLLREKTHGGIDLDGSSELLEIDNQEIILYGYTYNYGALDRDLYLLKTNFNGDSLWSKTYGGNGYEESQAFSRLLDGGYLLCGHSSSTDPNHNMYGVKIAVDGSQTWDVNFGGTNHDGGQALLINNDGNYVFIGRTMSFGAGMRDALMVISTPDGQEISSQYFGGLLNDRIDELIEDDNFYYLAGQTNSFGNGGADIYLIKFPK
tara:strand:+ start:3105 stop:4295 length:1191 start_codon:yes stop_codon:yes gene_type:complete